MRKAYLRAGTKEKSMIKYTKVKTGHYETKLRHGLATIKGGSGSWRIEVNGVRVGVYASSTLKGAKEILSTYDDSKDKALAEEEAHKLEKERIYLWKEQKELESQESLKINQPTPTKYKIGQRLSGIRFLGKENTVGQIIFSIKYGEEYDRLSEANYNGYYGYDSFYHGRSETLEVEHIVSLTNEEYYEFSNNLLTDVDFLKKGGTISDHTCDLPYFECLSLHKEEFLKTARNLVTVIQSPNRQPFLVDPQSYDYARYVYVLGGNNKMTDSNTI